MVKNYGSDGEQSATDPNNVESSSGEEGGAGDLLSQIKKTLGMYLW